MPASPGISKKQVTISKFFSVGAKKSTASADGAAVVVVEDEPKHGTLKRTKSTEVSLCSALKRSKASGHDEPQPKRSKTTNARNGSTENTLKGGGRDSSLHDDQECESLPPPSSALSHLTSFRAPKPERSSGVGSGGTGGGEDRSGGGGTDSNEGPSRVGPWLVPAGAKLTPLEQQVVALKKQYPDALLFVECGYKYRFFGSDAETAGRELNIVAHLDHNLMTASIPTHRLSVHLARLVARGYKVGVVKQVETAALKAAGSNKGGPFTRRLHALYTRATLVGEDVAGGEEGVAPAGTMLAVVLEEEKSGTSASLTALPNNKFTNNKNKKKKGIEIGLLCVDAGTGAVVWDHFWDGPSRAQLQSRLDHLQPVEAVLLASTSNATRDAIRHAAARHGDCVRVEVLPEDAFDYSAALRLLCRRPANDGADGEVEGAAGRGGEMEEDLGSAEAAQSTAAVAGLPGAVVRCYGAAHTYLKQFRLQAVLHPSALMRYSSSAQHLQLCGATVRNLEVQSKCTYS